MQAKARALLNRDGSNRLTNSPRDYPGDRLTASLVRDLVRRGATSIRLASRYTAEALGYVISSVALQRVDIKRRIPRWVAAWSSRVTSRLLQIEENDLWIAAQAVER